MREQPRRGGGHDEHDGDEQRADRVERHDGRGGDPGQQQPVGRAGRSPSARALPGSKPAASQCAPQRGVERERAGRDRAR